ncbi:GNAT family N-acetyltransferase [Rhizobium straminoryzae]|uniref:Aminoglycoside N(6')-acetyltransferase type 1 n=2 Tax=Rhizobium straminoryzae TaxID=1387186 RepID=A0A549T243_9HYPH|nr:GNAT family N-acetyltransferase [Rhizobium straminoryzae]
MTIEIRKMTGTDLDVWSRMRACLWQSLDLDGHRAEIVTMVGNVRHRAYLAAGSTGEAYGFAEVSIRDYANGCTQTPVPFLEGIWVEPAVRRLGVGAALLCAIQAELQAEGYVELCSDARLENLVSHEAHAAWGFEETQRVVYFRKAL